MSPSREPAVVAELGRPETPEETAARNAETSRDHRTRQTVTNLIYSLIATLAVVLVIVLAVPRATPSTHTNIDYAKVASQAQGTEPDALASPILPKAWTSNSAQLRTKNASGIDEWYIGFVTPSQQYIGFTQGFKADDAWLAGQVSNSTAHGSVTLDGVKWTVYDNRDTDRDVGNVKYALTTKAGDSSYVLVGNAPTSEFHVVARALADSVRSSAARR